MINYDGKEFKLREYLKLKDQLKPILKRISEINECPKCANTEVIVKVPKKNTDKY